MFSPFGRRNCYHFKHIIASLIILHRSKILLFKEKRNDIIIILFSYIYTYLAFGGFQCDKMDMAQWKCSNLDSISVKLHILETDDLGAKRKCTKEYRDKENSISSNAPLNTLIEAGKNKAFCRARSVCSIMTRDLSQISGWNSRHRQWGRISLAGKQRRFIRPLLNLCV